MGRRIKYLTIAIVLIIFMVLMYSKCGNTLLEDLVVDVERATGNIITINIIGNGSTNPATDIVVAKGDNSPIHISATPYTDWAFVQWQGSGVIFANPYSASTTIQLTGGDTTITAVFGDLTQGWPLMINNNGHGTTDKDGLQYVSVGADTNISVSPDTGYELTLSDWVIEAGAATVLGSPNTYTITVTSPATTIALADFALKQYTLTVNSDINGTTTPTGDVTVQHGVPQSITATPAEGYVLKDWTVESGDADIGNQNSTSTTATLTNGPATVQANFDKGYRLYWTTYTAPYTVNRASFDFSYMEQISSESTTLCTGIDIDTTNEHIYYSDYSGSIWKYMLDGSELDPSITNPIYNTFGANYAIALDSVNGKVYFSNDMGIHRMNLDGSAPELFVSGGGYRGVAVDAAGGYVYLTNLSGIYRATIAGTLPRPPSQVSSASGAYEIDLDVAAGQMYWVEYYNNKCGRKFMNGSGSVTYIVPSGLNYPRGIDLDVANYSMYITNQGSNSISVYDLDGNFLAFLPVPGSPSGIAVDTD